MGNENETPRKTTDWEQKIPIPWGAIDTIRERTARIKWTGRKLIAFVVIVNILLLAYCILTSPP